MKEFQNIKIIGFDEHRPPFIRKEPYIDLFFKLSHEPPEFWREDFNKLTKNLNPPAKIDTKQAVFIETYVRDMNHIPEHLNLMKKNISNCNEQYRKRCQQLELDARLNNNSIQSEGGAQGKLNAIIELLNFDDEC